MTAPGRQSANAGEFRFALERTTGAPVRVLSAKAEGSWRTRERRKLRDILTGRYTVQELVKRLCIQIFRARAPRQLAQRLVASDLPDPPISAPASR